MFLHFSSFHFPCQLSLNSTEYLLSTSVYCGKGKKICIVHALSKCVIFLIEETMKVKWQPPKAVSEQAAQLMCLSRSLGSIKIGTQQNKLVLNFAVVVIFEGPTKRKRMVESQEQRHRHGKVPFQGQCTRQSGRSTLEWRCLGAVEEVGRRRETKEGTMKSLHTQEFTLEQPNISVPPQLFLASKGKIRGNLHPVFSDTVKEGGFTSAVISSTW